MRGEHLVPPCARHQPGDHRLRPGGSSSSTETSRSPYTVSASVRGIGVAVMCSTCGARPSDRAFASSARALLDPEPVLLVDDGHLQAAEHHGVLHQRVRADNDLRLAGLDHAQRRPPLARRHPVDQLRDAHVERLAQRADAQQVLRRQRLGGGHQRPLAVALDGAQQGVHGDGGLARADVALQQPLHGHVLRQVAVDLAHRARLCPGRVERQLLQVAADQLAGLAQRPAPPPSAPAAGGGGRARPGAGTARRTPAGPSPSARRRLPPVGARPAWHRAAGQPARAAEGRRAARPARRRHGPGRRVDQASRRRRAGDLLAAVVDGDHPCVCSASPSSSSDLVTLRPTISAPIDPRRSPRTEMHRPRRQLLDQVALVEPHHQPGP